MSFLIQFHPSPDVLGPLGPSFSLIVRLHPSAAPSRLAAGAVSVAKQASLLFQTLRTAVGLSPAHDDPHRSRSLPRGDRATEARSQPPRGGSQVQSHTMPGTGRAGGVVTPWPSATPTVQKDNTMPCGPRDFASMYCAAHRLRRRQFVAAVFRHTLLPPVPRFGRTIVRLLPWAFARDRAFLAEVGSVRSVEQYGPVEERFRRWPVSPSFLGRTLGLRVSTHRVRRLVVGFFSGGR